MTLMIRIKPLTEKGKASIIQEFEKARHQLKLGLMKVAMEDDMMTVQLSNKVNKIVEQFEHLKVVYVEDIKRLIKNNMSEHSIVEGVDYEVQVIE